MNGKHGQEIERMAVKISHLDQLLGLTGEVIITSSNIALLQRNIQTDDIGLEKELMDMLKSVAMSSTRISSDLHHLVMDIRLIPIRETFLRFRRLVRELSKKKGRQVNFEIVGEDTLVDKTVAEYLYEPLAHQIRNAIDHGLEDPLIRQQKGKDPVGHLTLTAYKKEGFTYIQVEDDGRGLDEANIKETAIEKGLISQAETETMSRETVLNLIMRPGFSTAEETTEISGRGVGMDVVKSVVEELNGEVSIVSEPGQGTGFTYKIPQLSAVNITDALIIRSKHSFFAFPISNVVATQAFDKSQFNTTLGANESIIYLGSIIPIFDLGGLLAGQTITNTEISDVVPVIIIEAKNGRVGLKVSEFLRPQKLVLIPLPPMFTVKGVSGTTILGGNQLAMVIEPFDLISLATSQDFEITAEQFLSRETVTLDDDLNGDDIAGDEAAPKTAGDAATQPAARVENDMDGRLDDNMVQEFLHEIGSILVQLNEDVFQLEKEPENRDTINTIFRHFHSIKGNFVMTGYKNLAETVHQVETILDRMREDKLAVSEEIIDLFLDMVKVVEKALASIKAGEKVTVDDPELLELLDKYKPEEEKVEEEEDVSEDTFSLPPLSRILLHAKRVQKENLVQSLIKFKPSFQEPYLLAYLTLRRLAMIGDVIDTVPTLDRIERGLVGDRIKVMFSTRQSLEDVNRFMEQQLSRHFNVEGFENLMME